MFLKAGFAPEWGQFSQQPYELLVLLFWTILSCHLHTFSAMWSICDVSCNKGKSCKFLVHFWLPNFCLLSFFLKTDLWLHYHFRRRQKDFSVWTGFATWDPGTKNFHTHWDAAVYWIFLEQQAWGKGFIAPHMMWQVPTCVRYVHPQDLEKTHLSSSPQLCSLVLTPIRRNKTLLDDFDIFLEPGCKSASWTPKSEMIASKKYFFLEFLWS